MTTREPPGACTVRRNSGTGHLCPLIWVKIAGPDAAYESPGSTFAIQVLPKLQTVARLTIVYDPTESSRRCKVTSLYRLQWNAVLLEQVQLTMLHLQHPRQSIRNLNVATCIQSLMRCLPIVNCTACPGLYRREPSKAAKKFVVDWQLSYLTRSGRLNRDSSQEPITIPKESWFEHLLRPLPRGHLLKFVGRPTSSWKTVGLSSKPSWSKVSQRHSEAGASVSLALKILVVMRTSVVSKDVFFDPTVASTGMTIIDCAMCSAAEMLRR